MILFLEQLKTIILNKFTAITNQWSASFCEKELDPHGASYGRFELEIRMGRVHLSRLSELETNAVNVVVSSQLGTVLWAPNPNLKIQAGVAPQFLYPDKSEQKRGSSVYSVVIIIA